MTNYKSNHNCSFNKFEVFQGAVSGFATLLLKLESAVGNFLGIFQILYKQPLFRSNYHYYYLKLANLDIFAKWKLD